MAQKSDCTSFEAFATRYGDEAAGGLLERVLDAHCNRKPVEGITFHQVHSHNACNVTLCGTVVHDGKAFDFTIDNGDWNGTVVRAFADDGSAAPEDPPEPARFMFVPTDPDLEKRRPRLYQVYLAWSKQSWFLEKLRAYHYDSRMQPGHATESHYARWARSKGLRIAAV